MESTFVLVIVENACDRCIIKLFKFIQNKLEDSLPFICFLFIWIRFWRARIFGRFGRQFLRIFIESVASIGQTEYGRSTNVRRCNGCNCRTPHSNITQWINLHVRYEIRCTGSLYGPFGLLFWWDIFIYRSIWICENLKSNVCFAGGLFALGAATKQDKNSQRYMQIGEGITNTCHETYIRTATHLGPEKFGFVRYHSHYDFEQ